MRSEPGPHRGAARSLTPVMTGEGSRAHRPWKTSGLAGFPIFSKLAGSHPAVFLAGSPGRQRYSLARVIKKATQGQSGWPLASTAMEQSLFHLTYGNVPESPQAASEIQWEIPDSGHFACFWIPLLMLPTFLFCRAPLLHHPAFFASFS